MIAIKLNKNLMYLALALIPAAASCSRAEVEDAKQASIEQLAKTEQAAGEALEATQAIADEALEATKVHVDEALDLANEAAKTVKQSAVKALDQSRRFLASNKQELVDSLRGELEKLDLERAQIDELLATATSEARLGLTMFLAATQTKRESLNAKINLLQEATEEAWPEMQSGLEAKLAALEKSLAATRTQVEEALSSRAHLRSKSKQPEIARPKELFEVLKVVDGDTVHILRKGKTEKLRLLSVDTEEKLSGRAFSPSKPETLYGEETKLWAMDFFASQAGADGVSRIGLAFPEGEENYDLYGRLLCHVILADGTDFNLKLVREGRSPYFMKYGYSRIGHADFEAAEKDARDKQLGIWNPTTNKPKRASDPWHKRDYTELVPWWRCRAEAIETFRSAHAASPEMNAAADDEAALVDSAKYCKLLGYPISAFGTLERTTELADGSLNLQFQANKGAKRFTARILPELRASYAKLNLKQRRSAGRQNYLFAVGQLKADGEGFTMDITDAHSLRLGAPDPE